MANPANSGSQDVASWSDEVAEKLESDQGARQIFPGT
jgi:hypothetical protein